MVEGYFRMVDVSIIIINWNTQDLLIRCLEAIFATVRDVEYEVIVVDNGSKDQSVPLVRERFPEVEIFENRENLGFAKANNLGIQEARGRYYLLVNTDAFVHDDAVKSMMRVMEAYPDTGAAGCRLYYEDGRLQRSCYSFPSVLTELWTALGLDKLFSKNRAFGRYRMTYWDFDDFREVDSVVGACMILRREAIDEVGSFDEQFFMYSEEVDLCYRLKKAGWKVRFIPEASATHIWGGSANRLSDERTMLRLYESRVRFFRKHYGLVVTVLYKLVILLQSALRIVVAPVAGIILRDQKMSQKARSYMALLRSLPAF